MRMPQNGTWTGTAFQMLCPGQCWFLYGLGRLDADDTTLSVRKMKDSGFMALKVLSVRCHAVPRMTMIGERWVGRSCA